MPCITNSWKSRSFPHFSAATLATTKWTKASLHLAFETNKVHLWKKTSEYQNVRRGVSLFLTGGTTKPPPKKPSAIACICPDSSPPSVPTRGAFSSHCSTVANHVDLQRLLLRRHEHNGLPSSTGPQSRAAGDRIPWGGHHGWIFWRSCQRFFSKFRLQMLDIEFFKERASKEPLFAASLTFSTATLNNYEIWWRVMTHDLHVSPFFPTCSSFTNTSAIWKAPGWHLETGAIADHIRLEAPNLHLLEPLQGLAPLEAQKGRVANNEISWAKHMLNQAVGLKKPVGWSLVMINDLISFHF